MDNNSLRQDGHWTSTLWCFAKTEVRNLAGLLFGDSFNVTKSFFLTKTKKFTSNSFSLTKFSHSLAKKIICRFLPTDPVELKYFVNKFHYEKKKEQHEWKTHIQKSLLRGIQILNNTFPANWTENLNILKGTGNQLYSTAHFTKSLTQFLGARWLN